MKTGDILVRRRKLWSRPNVFRYDELDEVRPPKSVRVIGDNDVAIFVEVARVDSDVYPWPTSWHGLREEWFLVVYDGIVGFVSKLEVKRANERR